MTNQGDLVSVIIHAYPQADTSKEESAIDEMVYQLYGLSEEEIKIVEGKS